MAKLDYDGRSRNDGKINPFAGTAYESLWENNPYAGMYYDPSFWDKIGFSNKAKDANNEYERLYNEFISGIYQQQQQDLYNSPSNQAQLEKEAGLNPDLTGVSGSGATGGMTPPNAGPNPALNGVSPAQSAFGVITQVLGFATSTLQSIETIKGLSSSRIGQNLSNISSFMDVARPTIISEFAKRFSGSDGNNWSDVRDVSSMVFDSRSEQRKYKKVFDSLLNSSRFSSATSAYDQLSDNDRAINTFLSGIIDLEIQAKKHNYKGSIAKAVYDTDYFNTASGKQAADFDSMNASSTAWLNKWRSEYYNKLYKQWKNGNKLSGLLLIGLGGSAISSGTSIGTSTLSSLLNFFK